jgi:phospholipase/lecithinase/hemolysin
MCRSHFCDVKLYTWKFSLALVFTKNCTNAFMLNHLTQTLNDMGAKRIGFIGIPPMGCCPSQRTLAGGPSSECEPLRNQASALFNTRISREIDRLNAERNGYGSKFVYVDIYYHLLDLIQNPALYGKSYVFIHCKSILLSANLYSVNCHYTLYTERCGMIMM